MSDRVEHVNLIRDKLSLAARRIAELKSEVMDFFTTNESYIVKNLNYDQTEEIWAWRLKNNKITHISALAGEIAHSLRSPLDNIVCEISLKYSGRSDRTYFPFHKNGPQDWEKQLKERCKDLPETTKNYLRGLQPWRGGDALLWALHDLNREDKHPGVYAVSSTSGMQMRELFCESGRVLVLGSLFGQHLIMGGHVPKRLPFEQHLPGEFLTTTPRAVVRISASPMWQIAFTSAFGFHRSSIGSVLTKMHQRVTEIVDEMIARFLTD